MLRSDQKPALAGMGGPGCAPEVQGADAAPHFSLPRGPLLLLGLLAALGLEAEGALYDWSVLFLVQERAADPALAALAYAAFTGAMALGRFGGDAVRAEALLARRHVLLREGDERPADGAKRELPRSRGREQRIERLELRGPAAEERVFLRGKVAEERAPRDVRGGGDVVHRDRAEAPLVEQLLRDALERLAGGRLLPVAEDDLGDGACDHALTPAPG